MRLLLAAVSISLVLVACSGETGNAAGGESGDDVNRDPGSGSSGGSGGDGGDGSDGPNPPPLDENVTYVALYGEDTELEPAVVQDRPDALVTRLGDRARDRHAREDEFRAYDHYLAFYWEHRTAAIEIVDTVGRGGDSVTFNVTTQWPLIPNQAELRFFYRGIGTVAEYYDNAVMTNLGANRYTRTVNFNSKTNAPLAVGDRMEFELSQFLDAPPRGRSNYYGTTHLYIVGQGLVPWEARGTFGDGTTEREDSYPIPQEGRLGGDTTLSYQYSDEPDNQFLQMATNLSADNAQVFVLGRRVHHTDMQTGEHNESSENPRFAALSDLVGEHYIGRSCVSCHARNGRALPPSQGIGLTQYVIKVGTEGGETDPQLGAVLQPISISGAPEGGAYIASWDESNGLRSPVFAFTGTEPERFSARIAPQLVGMGLLEAIQEIDIEALADPNDRDSDGISGRVQVVTDPETGDPRVGRFGWKAGQASLRHQVAAALNTDMGVMSEVRPDPDCGSAQTDCGPSGSEIASDNLRHLTAYVALLGVRARRDLDDSVALQGEVLFGEAGCEGCHVASYQTTPHHPHAELRDQTIAPYTDLLLHDMGPGLASTLGEARASGSEWRTAPLWGIGKTEGVSGGDAYLHDGRARTLDEAIRWHGGEGEAAKSAYVEMSGSERDALIAFLMSL